MPPISVTNWESKLKTVIWFKECDDNPGANKYTDSQSAQLNNCGVRFSYRRLEAHSHLEEEQSHNVVQQSFPNHFFYKIWCCFSLLRHFSLQMCQTAMPPWKGTWASIIIIFYDQYRGVFSSSTRWNPLFGHQRPRLVCSHLNSTKLHSGMLLLKRQ